MKTLIDKQNFTKWLAFSFPYMANLLSDLIIWLFAIIISAPVSLEHQTTIFIICNSFAILFGIQIITNYTHVDNCENYSPGRKGFRNLK